MPKPKGRPSDFKPEFIDQAKKACELGATDADLAEFFKVDVRTIYRWKHEHPDFCQALKHGKDVADQMVEQSLFRKATGYSHAATKIFQYEGAPVTVDYTEHTPPDTTACIFWLKNRKPKEWRDRIEHAGDADSPITVVIRKFGAGDSASE